MDQFDIAPGWYHAQGDSGTTKRYWDGQQWQGSPRQVEGAANAVDAARSPFAWFLLAVSRWSQFEGRATRSEYWWFLFFQGLLPVVPLFLALGLFFTPLPLLGVLLFVLVMIYMVAMIIPSLAVSVRRLHDTNKSGWWFVILGVLPIVNVVGSMVLFIFYCIDSDRGANQYGASPKYAPEAVAPWGGST